MDSIILMQRELSTFPLAPNYLHKLSSAGYITVDDLKDVSPSELSEGKWAYSSLIDWTTVCSRFQITSKERGG